MHHISQYAGKLLFKCRAWIAVPFFILLVLLSCPAVYPVIAYALMISGFVIRIWAAGYIGVSARDKSFATQVRIKNGPYRFFKHPLYLGNFFLVSGVTILFNPPVVYALIIIVMFIIIYGIIILSEQAYISQLSESKVTFHIKNCTGELSTIVVLLIIILINVFVPKNILLNP